MAANPASPVSTPPDRALPNARLRRLMLSIQDVMGLSGLATILRQAGLQRFANALPPNDTQPALRAAEYAALLQAIENYYGRGARGILTRIGYASFARLVAAQPVNAGLTRRLLRLLPMSARRLAALRWYALRAHAPGARLSVRRDALHLQVVDAASDGTVGRQRETPICWLTLGEIQEALKWGTGLEHEVSELDCRAAGNAACRFEIGAPLS
jgi:predicted hydrocarbon binding protein